MQDDRRRMLIRRISLVRLIGQSVALEPFDDRKRGSCTLHPDPTASLFVSEHLCIFHCFACSFGGDAVRWISRRDDVDEEAALSFLATIVGSGREDG